MQRTLSGSNRFAVTVIRAWAASYGYLLPFLASRLPREPSAGVQTFQVLAVFEGVHAVPETVVGVADQLLFLEQAMEGFDDQFFFFPHVVEDLFLEDEVSAVDAQIVVVNGMNVRNQAAIAAVRSTPV